MQTERLVFITQCHVDRNWPAQARVRLYHSCTAMSLVRLQSTCALIQKKFLGRRGGPMDIYVCQRGEGGQIYSVILLSKFKKKGSFQGAPTPHLLSSRSTHGIHSCLIFKENIVYHIYVV